MGYHWEPLQRRESVLKVTFQLVVNRRNAKSFTCFVFLSGEVAGKSNTLLLLNVSLSGKGRGIRSIVGPYQPFVDDSYTADLS